MKKKIKTIVLSIFVLILLIPLVSVAPVDRSAHEGKSYYENTYKKIQDLKKQMQTSQIGSIKAGWSKVDLTPEKPLPMAGYGDREGKPYQKIHDKIWVRTLLLENEFQKAALVTADILLMPPAVLKELKDILPETGLTIDRIYFGATHTHNSIGGWAEKHIGSHFAGEYNHETVKYIAYKIKDSINKAETNMEKASFGNSRYHAGELIYNRLVGKKGDTDPWLRVMKIKTRSGKTAVVSSFSAHATCLPAEIMEISGGYPGKMVDLLEKNTHIDFAMFLAGAVGSQGPYELPQKDEFKQVTYLAEKLADIIVENEKNISLQNKNRFHMSTLDLELRDPQMRFAENWRIRPWLFYYIFGEYPAHISTLRIGNMVFVGMPADFSGELVKNLDSVSNLNNINLAVTSFNGGYIGYVTKDTWYDLDEYETRTMSWYGPNTGSYLTGVIDRLIRNYES